MSFFHIIPFISRRSSIIPWAYRLSGWYHDLGLIKGMIWKMSCNNLHVYAQSNENLRLCDYESVTKRLYNYIYHIIIQPWHTITRIWPVKFPQSERSDFNKTDIDDTVNMFVNHSIYRIFNIEISIIIIWRDNIARLIIFGILKLSYDLCSFYFIKLFKIN